MSFAHARNANGARIIPGPNPTFAQYERRRCRRFPLTAQARYIAGGNQAQATIRDISSGGLFLKTERILRIGETIQVFIDWPVLLEDRCPLRLVIRGIVLRSDESGAAVGLANYEFKIRPTLIVHRIPA